MYIKHTAVLRVVRACVMRALTKWAKVLLTMAGVLRVVGYLAA
jgi:hypothetical protein